MHRQFSHIENLVGNTFPPNNKNANFYTVPFYINNIYSAENFNYIRNAQTFKMGRL